ncbi:X box binding protein-1 [Operophtera brumata]|uniref:X-box-binding protein 1 n=2 Tax=Operophtera brumata TaxID=104452 RepID=A0A0L7KI35_OPEBR|nr:X box binding protein-1 [Operophtera brumata]KOB64440.1 X box binding protein-1 [Operophtera brumata]
MSGPIIITVPNSYLMDMDMEEDSFVDVSPSPSRKRRLDHLSWEEKMQRKKMKNRVAAQTSRDRKKAKMDEMEARIDGLEERNEKLMNEVESLKALNERLLSENCQLRSEAAARTAAEAPGPAESPQQKDGPPPAIRAARLLVAMILLSQTSSRTSSLKSISTPFISSQTPSSKRLMQELQERLRMDSRECPKGAEVVGPAAEQLEPNESRILDIKHDVHRILTQHSYAHPYNPDVIISAPEEKEDNDKGDIFYASCDEDNDCVTVEVPCEDIVEEVTPITVETDFKSLTNNCSGITLECDMKMLSPMSLSPESIEENLLGLSPSQSLSSDLGYESLASPLSEPDSLDLSDFWCESFSELFPGLA